MKLKQFRRIKGLKQNYVAEQLGITQSYLSNIENGKVKPPEKIRLALAKLYNISELELVSLIYDKVPAIYLTKRLT